MANEVRLIDAPVGLFMCGDCLGMKTQYMVNGRVEAYVVESGETFWGGVKTAEEVNNLLVIPAGHTVRKRLPLKIRCIDAGWFTMCAMGLFWMFFLVYFLISRPDAPTWYEIIMTALLSSVLADKLCRRTDV